MGGLTLMIPQSVKKKISTSSCDHNLKGKVQCKSKNLARLVFGLGKSQRSCFRNVCLRLTEIKAHLKKGKLERGPRTASPWMRLEAEIGPVTVSQTKAYFEPEV